MCNTFNRAELDIVKLRNENFIKISNCDEMRPFFMNIVSDSNHWMFISSNGGITAGRKNPEFALFPYYTDDKISESSETTGSKTIFKIDDNDVIRIWEPFSDKFSNEFKISRSIYKSLEGNKVVFEEINHDLELTYRYQWNTSNLYGIVKKGELINNSLAIKKVTVLDGIQNIIPYGISSDLQRFASNLGDAYKRNELVAASGLGIYSLSAMIVDKAEPSEALKANIAWSIGFDKPKYLLSSLQINNFRKGLEIESETDVKGEKGAYFVLTEISLPASTYKKWKIVGNVNQTHSNIAELSNFIVHNTLLNQDIDQDIDLGTKRLTQLVASADGLQLTANPVSDIRHYSNVLFNIMRGGVFDDNYIIEKEDFISYLSNANKDVVARNENLLNKLDTKAQRHNLKKNAEAAGDSDLLRLTIEYLPLKFSRRHGDPSRPWNYFTINTRDESNGKKILDYEGNWRDLFQNWEALAHSYPEYIDGMIFKFLNASTFDGNNPYRVTKKGFDWETIEPDNPWSYIGYWGDHQIIYLLKFLEIAENYFPKSLERYFSNDLFVYAAVPYIIKPYEQLLENPYETIEFSNEWDQMINDRRNKYGADGALLTLDDNQIYKVNMLEKILLTVLSKLSNFIPEAGIWMNTQRPEWNDANNALVGNGVSMVTLYYLRRFMRHLLKIISNLELEHVNISIELNEFFKDVNSSLTKFRPLLAGQIHNKDRKQILDCLGRAACNYRGNIYSNGFSGKKEAISLIELTVFIQTTIAFIDHSISANKRPDKLYHAYNLMSSTDSEISITHLSQMLEGQVAVLSSGYLSPEESLEVLDSLRDSLLYRQDQNSYILYPNKNLPGFLEKNTIQKEKVFESELLSLMIKEEDHQIIEEDVNGDFHFNGNFNNVKDIEEALKNISSDKYTAIISREEDYIKEVFEEVFNHKSFTGRSGTFFAYEGLGSIYWHMVSKLLLSVQECCIRSLNREGNNTITDSLIKHFFNIKEGIGLHKLPELYGAFPTDPYSHTPMHRGAQQPGMTGQVKEDILVNYGELGVFVHNGILHFHPELLRIEFFLHNDKQFEFIDQANKRKLIKVNQNSILFTFCQIPIIYQVSENTHIKVDFKKGNSAEFNTLQLNKELSAQVFQRSPEISSITVSIPKKHFIQT